MPGLVKFDIAVVFKSALSSVVTLMNQLDLGIFNCRFFVHLYYFHVIIKNPVSSLAILTLPVNDDNKCHVFYSLIIS